MARFEAELGAEGFDAVLDAARGGADWAWERLYRALAPVVIGYLRAQGSADPEEAAADTFLQAVRDIRRFSGDESGFRSWLFVIAHHRFLDERRRRSRRPEDLVGDVPGQAGTEDVERDALEADQTRRIRTLLQRLPSGQRDVLLLRIVAGLTVDEAAKVLGKRAGAVKMLQRRGLDTLRAADVTL